MSRIRNPENLMHLVSAAIRVFRSKGYRATKVSDIAQEMGVSPATIYLYVESKEALFHLILRHAFFPQNLTIDHLPYPAPSSGDVLRDLRGPFGEAAIFAQLDEYFTRPGIGDPHEHLKTGLAYLYDRLVEYADGINLLERCASDWRELHEFFYRVGRKNLIDRIRGFIERGVDLGFVETPDAGIAARMVLEASAWFAIHRCGDPAPGIQGEAAIKETVVASLTRALLAGKYLR